MHTLEIKAITFDGALDLAINRLRELDGDTIQRVQLRSIQILTYEPTYRVYIFDCYRM